ncbi:helix-turn-helix domain-containing protein [Terasakiella pusilla]|uniref:helix-turn-helix domain-containing protein n=1 Tax=Terasakiella pusilla TaxID=64973 RepID=UPI003AA8A758
MNELSQHHKPLSPSLITARGDGINPIDYHVGQRVKKRRTEVGLTQGALGDKIGITFQQIQKYERGANRICASRLYLLAHTLDVAITYFFDELPDTIANSQQLDDIDTVGLKASYDDIHRRHHLEINRVFSQMNDPEVRRRFIDLGRAITGDLVTQDTPTEG